MDAITPILTSQLLPIHWMSKIKLSNTEAKQLPIQLIYLFRYLICHLVKIILPLPLFHQYKYNMNEQRHPHDKKKSNSSSTPPHKVRIQNGIHIYFHVLKYRQNMR